MASLATNWSALQTLTGGLPNAHQDTFPSILFLALFGATFLLCAFRMLRTYRTPTRLLLTFVRMQLFELVRVATFVVRLMGIANYRDVAKGTAAFNTTLLTVEQILLSVGYLMPASTLVKLAGLHSSRHEGGDVIGGTKNITRAMELALTVAIVLGIVAGTNVSKAQTDAKAAQSVKTERCDGLGGHRDGRAGPASAFLRPGIAFQGDTGLDVAWLGGTSLVLMVVPIFRLISTGSPPANSNSTDAKAAFYILQVTVEWLVGASLLIIDAKKWCGIQDAAYMSTYQDEEAHKLAYTSGSF